MRRINETMSDLDKSNLARAVFTSMGNALEKMITYHIKEKPVHTLIAVGGVMSNSLLRKRMETYCKRNHMTLHVAQHNILLIMLQAMLLALLIYKNLEDHRECINHYTIEQSHKAHPR